MIGVDTNVLVRYIVQDDKAQSILASGFIENECLHKGGIFINGVVLCELVWVLETVYDYSRESIGNVLEKILLIGQFHFRDQDVLWQALKGYRNDVVDFADHYISCFNSNYGCENTVTFDKKAAKTKNFRLLK